MGRFNAPRIIVLFSFLNIWLPTQNIRETGVFFVHAALSSQGAHKKLFKLWSTNCQMWNTLYGISKFSYFVPLCQRVFLFSVHRTSLVCKINVSHIITSLFHLQVKISCQLRRRECDHRPWLSRPGLGLGCLSARSRVPSANLLWD